MKPLLLITLFVSTLACSTISKNQNPPWLKISDGIAEKFTRDFSALYPELGSGLGYTEFDKKGVHFSSALIAREIKLYKRWQEDLKSLLESTDEKNLQVDYQILLERVDRSLESIELVDQLKMVPFFEGSQSVYHSLFQLVNPQSSQKRNRSALARLKEYVSPQVGKPLLLSYQVYMREKMNEFGGKRPLFPFVGEVKKYLEDSPSYVKGVEELLKESQVKNWQKDFDLFKEQVTSYDSFVKEVILPKVRDTPQLPYEFYRLTLSGTGVDATPEELIQVGRSEYKKLYKKYLKLAQEVAKKNNLKDSRPKAVIDFLKQKQVTENEKVRQLYLEADQKLSEIVRSNNLVTLPGRSLQIRLASDAESKANPVPHVSAPPLVNNRGELPEFIVPTSSSGKLPFDDFSYVAAATILTAHEGRPGHELQFSRMLESPISIIRGRYAFNAVNVEGWALYAEDMVYPYLSLEEQFVALQMRLWRIARYFLDPEVQLSRANLKSVERVFYKELGVSQKMAKIEYERYAFLSPGQATSYFHGLRKIRNIKKMLQEKYGSLSEDCFNNTLLSFGLMPHDLIELFSDEFAKCKM